uniref:Probable deoxycytidylate deaminase n=1 Tax=Glossina brevipalpis TaxID=37001 RepID=A0A1A9W7D8_9MUSC
MANAKEANFKALKNCKRDDYLQLDDYFMIIAIVTAQRSKDPSTQVGAVIVNEENRIVGVGYNGFPQHCSDDVFPWHKPEDVGSDDPLQHKKLYVVHAEANAILNSNCANLKNTRIYTTLFPCNECTKLILQKGISKIYYISDKYADKPEFQASKIMLDAAGKEYKKHKPTINEFTINIEQTSMMFLFSCGNMLQMPPKAEKKKKLQPFVSTIDPSRHAEALKQLEDRHAEEARLAEIAAEEALEEEGEEEEDEEYSEELMENEDAIMIGRIDMAFPETTEEFADSELCYPPSYYTLSPKERLILLYVENFRHQYIINNPNRRPLVMALPNECKVQKFVCTTIRPTAFLHVPLIRNAEECAKFVADFIIYEPLEDMMSFSFVSSS